MQKFSAVLLALLLAACATPITAPESGPVASLHVVSPNSSSSLLSMDVQNLYYNFKSLDGSWKGELFGSANTIKDKTFQVPAGKALALGFTISQGGAAFDGTCGLVLDTEFNMDASYLAEFTTTRLPGSKKIGGCTLKLFQIQEDGPHELIGTYPGDAQIRNFRVKVTVL